MSSSAQEPRDRALWRRLLAIDPDERASVGLAAGAFFALLFAIFLLRPLRDEMGLRGGTRELPELWTFTLGGTIVASLAFAAIASRMPRRRFMALAYRSIGVLWLAFLPALLVVDDHSALGIALARCFYVVHAVSNVFMTSILWALLADVFSVAQSKRLFGVIAIGGTLGAVIGPAVTGLVAPHGWALWLIVPAAVALEASVRFGARLQDSASIAPRPEAKVALGGHALRGVELVTRSPYLAGIALFTFLFGVVQTFFTFQQNLIVEQHYAAGVTAGGLAPGTKEYAQALKEAQQAYFAWAENGAQTLTLLVQLFVTGRLMKRIGVGGALLVLPVIGVVGFTTLGAAHVSGWNALVVVTSCLVLWRGLSHATQRPAREALYVPTTREEKYKAKSFTDTFAFRGGDLAGAWSFKVFTAASAAFVAIPLAALLGVLALWLGRRQRALADRADPSA